MADETHADAGRQSSKIGAIVERLRDVYTREGIDVWLHARNRDLDGHRPIDLLQARDFATVRHVIERLRSGAT
jgi:hypothetical protein